MTKQEIHHLIALWESDPTPPFRADPWILGWLPRGQEWAETSALKNRPDFGWTFAYRMMGSRYSLPLLKRPAYRWIRVAMDLLAKYSTSLDLPGDVAAVARAREIHHTGSVGPVLDAALLTREATVESVAKAFHLPPDTVEAYERLFFNVLDRRDDLAYIRGIVEFSYTGSLMIAGLPARTEEEMLLETGFEGTIDDVLTAVGWGGDDSEKSTPELAEQLRRNIMKAAMKSLASQQVQQSPALVGHAIGLAKGVFGPGTGAEDPFVSGDSMGAILAAQLLTDSRELEQATRQKMLSKPDGENPA